MLTAAFWARMKPRCAEGEAPTAGEGRSHVAWYCDDEPVVGEFGDSKLMVSVSLAAFLRWEG